MQTATDWVLHGQTAYVNLLPQAEYRIACDTALFSLNTNHGIRPQRGEYAYLVHPGISTVSTVAKYAADLPIKILANTEKIQAARHEKLGITEIIFYQPGELRLENGDILATDTPCALLWKEKKRKFMLQTHVANRKPRKDNDNPNPKRANQTNIVRDAAKEEAGKSCTAPLYRN